MSLVKPPKITIPKTFAALARSQYATILSLTSGKNLFLLLSTGIFIHLALLVRNIKRNLDSLRGIISLLSKNNGDKLCNLFSVEARAGFDEKAIENIAEIGSRGREQTKFFHDVLRKARPNTGKGPVIEAIGFSTSKTFGSSNEYCH